MKPLFVILVTYRRFEEFKRTFNSLVPTLPKDSKLVIVHNPGDNGDSVRYGSFYSSITAPGAVELEIEIVFIKENRGWGTAMNAGLAMQPEWKEYEYVLESNNDVLYDPDWFERAKALMEKWPEIGILGLWKHKDHGVRAELDGGLMVKDNMPATAWLMRSKDLQEFLPFPEKGPCNTRGGNGEDSNFVEKVQKQGRWVAGPQDDLAHHMDGYDNNLGKENEAYL